jgi:hypothetical protein
MLRHPVALPAQHTRVAEQEPFFASLGMTAPPTMIAIRYVSPLVVVVAGIVVLAFNQTLSRNGASGRRRR